MNNFDIEEFACSCCGEAPMDSEFLQMIDEAREFANVPFIINSGYRCESHNKAVGGVASSSHRYGKAADIKATDSRTRFFVIKGLIEAGFDRIGIAGSFVHADNDDSKSEDVAWVYK